MQLLVFSFEYSYALVKRVDIHDKKMYFYTHTSTAAHRHMLTVLTNSGFALEFLSEERMDRVRPLCLELYEYFLLLCTVCSIFHPFVLLLQRTPREKSRFDRVHTSP